MTASPARHVDPSAPLPADLLDAWRASSPRDPKRHLALVTSRPRDAEHHLTVIDESRDSRSALVDRALALFVTPKPAAPTSKPSISATRFAPRVVVLGTPQDAPPVAAGLANALRRRERTAAAVLLAWPAEAAHPAPAVPAASRLAARLAARGLSAVPRGRLAWVPLSEPSTEAATRLAGTVDEPLVTAAAGPRTDAIEALLEEQDLVAVVTRDPEGPLARLALASIAVPAIALPPLTGGARRLALAGFGTARAFPVEAATVRHRP